MHLLQYNILKKLHFILFYFKGKKSLDYTTHTVNYNRKETLLNQQTTIQSQNYLSSLKHLDPSFVYRSIIDTKKKR